jgi:hypothetical protein
MQDPFMVAGDQAEILTMQLNKLRASWLEQDHLHYDTNTDFPTPIINPDIIEEADLKSPDPGSPDSRNPAFDKLKERREWIERRLSEIQAAHAQKTLEGFDHAVNFVLGELELNTSRVTGIEYLLALEQRYTEGLDIAPALRAIPLELAAFIVLLRLRKLANADTDDRDTDGLLESEWQEFDNILVQVKKQREFKRWTEAEQQANLTLEPNVFRLRSTPLDLIPWRATWRSRRNWENALDARISQREALIQAHHTAIEATEAIALPLLRDALIATINRQGYPEMDVADWLTQRLSMSFKYSGDQKLSRLAQGVETLQDMLLAIRTGRLETVAMWPVGTTVSTWELAVNEEYSEYDFDKEWEWMGSYATWRGAMSAFGYPENYLLPTLRDKQEWTIAYSKLVRSVRQARRLTPNEAEVLAAEYVNTLKLPKNPDRPEDGGDGISFDYELDLTSQLTKEQLRERRARSKADLDPYVDPVRGGLKPHPDTPPYLKEAHFFVPMLL